MKQQKLLSLIRQAIQDYNMIEDGDRIAVGVSGGKDSLTLLYAMKLLQEFYPKRFELSAITCNVGFEGMDFTGVADFCKHLEIPYEQVNTEIARIVFQENKDTRPCSLCAKLRKGAMYQRLGELGINKMAYAHNKDDFIETALMSLIYEGRFYAFPPVTELPIQRLPGLYFRRIRIQDRVLCVQSFGRVRCINGWESLESIRWHMHIIRMIL